MPKPLRKFWGRKVALRSPFEDAIKADLNERGIEYGYETITLEYIKSTCPHCGESIKKGKYKPDFVIIRKTGIPLVVEAKGRLTTEDRKKLRSVKQANPKVDLRILFQVDNLIRKGAKSRYSEWATKNGFINTVGTTIPQEWIRR